MINTSYDQNTPAVQYVLRPNQSWTWRANLWFLAVLCTVSMCIALSFAWHGLWMILPFSLLELTALFFCLWLCVRRGYRQEVIVLQPGQVFMQKGQRQLPPRITIERTFDRFFTRFHVERKGHPWRNPCVLLRYRDEHHEIGSFLAAEEKLSLIAELRRGIRYVDAGLIQ
jgi:uncharacterized membrane protein